MAVFALFPPLVSGMVDFADFVGVLALIVTCAGMRFRVLGGLVEDQIAF